MQSDEGDSFKIFPCFWVICDIERDMEKKRKGLLMNKTHESILHLC